MATSTPIGTAISVAIETMIRLPTIASASPARLAEEAARLGEEVDAQRRGALDDHRADHEAEHGDGGERRQRRQDGEDQLDDPAPPEAGRADGDVVRAHEIAPRERSKRRTTVCAATFVISEITSRIAAR